MWIRGGMAGCMWHIPCSLSFPQILSTASSSAHSEQSPSLLLVFSPAKDHTALPANDYSSGQHQSVHTWPQCPLPWPQCPLTWPKIKVRWDRHQSSLTLMGRAVFASSFCSEALHLVSCSRWSTAQLSLQFCLEIHINAAQNMANLTSLSCCSSWLQVVQFQLQRMLVGCL